MYGTQTKASQCYKCMMTVGAINAVNKSDDESRSHVAAIGHN